MSWTMAGCLFLAWLGVVAMILSILAMNRLDDEQPPTLNTMSNDIKMITRTEVGEQQQERHAMELLTRLGYQVIEPAQQGKAAATVYRYGRDSHGKQWHGVHWHDRDIDAPTGTKLYTHPAPAVPADIDALIERVSDALGMSHGAWDMADARTLVLEILGQAGMPAPTSEGATS
jgi:ethanolamine utilization protein EutP (predicted NTPase)